MVVVDSLDMAYQKKLAEQKGVLNDRIAATLAAAHRELSDREKQMVTLHKDIEMVGTEAIKRVKAEISDKVLAADQEIQAGVAKVRDKAQTVKKRLKSVGAKAEDYLNSEETDAAYLVQKLASLTAGASEILGIAATGGGELGSRAAEAERALRGFAERASSLLSEAAAKEVQKEMALFEAEAAQIRGNANLSHEEREQALANLRKRTANSIRNIMKEEGITDAVIDREMAAFRSAEDAFASTLSGMNRDAMALGGKVDGDGSHALENEKRMFSAVMSGMSEAGDTAQQYSNKVQAEAASGRRKAAAAGEQWVAQTEGTLKEGLKNLEAVDQKAGEINAASAAGTRQNQKSLGLITDALEKVDEVRYDE